MNICQFWAVSTFSPVEDVTAPRTKPFPPSSGIHTSFFAAEWIQRRLGACICIKKNHW